MVAQDENLCESLSRNDNILEKLKKAAQDGDIERLYELIRADENILGYFDKMPFCETPLHIAAENGQTHFAIQVMTLKPSLALKLNVKGRGRITPLHHR
ncbi:Ankyrin repeat-containing domain superfamily [Arabidopsis suecica]|uniref:Ankyrin repeat-containing domain superfamily n=1 Tax=Arabidopsis suecica TaxID=45249 RepID=A0A8T2AEA6_ARASU|nr:Ankyrin repeat-containing domain superfamily [Arabidopsis suecica]